jgi:hypothetical protein
MAKYAIPFIGPPRRPASRRPLPPGRLVASRQERVRLGERCGSEELVERLPAVALEGCDERSEDPLHLALHELHEDVMRPRPPLPAWTWRMVGTSLEALVEFMARVVDNAEPRFENDRVPAGVTSPIRRAARWAVCVFTHGWKTTRANP